MSQRVTRSTARLSTGSTNPANPPANEPPPAAPTRSRKRKASGGEPAADTAPTQAEPPAKTRGKRKKLDESEAAKAPAPSATTSTRKKRTTKATPIMANTESDQPSLRGGSDEATSPSAEGLTKSSSTPAGTSSSSSAKRKDSRKKDIKDTSPPTATPSSSRRRKKGAAKSDADVKMEDAENTTGSADSGASAEPPKPELGDDGLPVSHPRSYDEDDDDEDDDDNPFGGGGYMGRGPGGISSTLRALSGMMTGLTSRLRMILDQLRTKEDPTIQMLALQEFSDLLLISNEDSLAGHFSPDAYVKELVQLMQPNEFTGEENPEIMLLACRCIANMIEALPPSTANVVYGGAVPILCQKLLEIHYIDLAEQALSTLEKISQDFPAAIVREGGLTACLNYLDFFATSTQRTAVTTAANCCRNIPEDSFDTIRDVMPILLNVLGSNDQKVVEQGCICVSRIVESFRMHHSKLEELVSADLLKAILRLLLPGTTNLIGPNIHTQFLRVLSHVAHASPLRSTELLKMHVVDTLYQILAGVSPPSGTEDVAMKIDSVVIMQALIHRPREQISETLSVICELLPEEQTHFLSGSEASDSQAEESEPATTSKEPSKSPSDRRREMLDDLQDEVRRFAVILLPTLTDAYSSTVNLSVRQQVLRAHLKMLSNFSVSILEDALKPVPYASYLASILSQQDHPTLVTYALQAAELLLTRLGHVYQYQFSREGVMSEIVRLANRPTKALDDGPKPVKAEESKAGPSTNAADAAVPPQEQTAPEPREAREDRDMDSPSDEDDEDHEDDEDDDDDDDSSSSHSSDRRYAASLLPNIQDLITLRAKMFVEIHEQANAQGDDQRASNVLEDLRSLATDIKQAFAQGDSARGKELFQKLAEYFDGDALNAITSYELLSSDIVQVFLDLFGDSTEAAQVAKSTFLEAFMGSTIQSKQKIGSATSPATPFSVLVHKLQDLLSRSEHFEVITVHHNTYDRGQSSPASMLAKQLRLRLVADDDSGIPSMYKNVMVSIHAIATFKALDDYLRPRLSIAERPRSHKSRDRVSSAVAAYAAALGIDRDHPDLRNALLGGPPPHLSGDASNRPSSRKSNKSKPSGSSTETPAAAATPKSAPQSTPASSGLRRSSRRNPTQFSPPPPAPAAQKTEGSQTPLECADETQLSDEDDGLDASALNDIVGDFDDTMADTMAEDAPDPSAVNMEVAATGKVTARTEDGARVATPLQNTPSAGRPPTTDRLNARIQALSRASPSHSPLGSSSSPRPSSYAAALQATPQDWHLQFSVNGQTISNETTIYRAVHLNQIQADETGTRPLWNGVHSINFKRVNGPPPEPNKLAKQGDVVRDEKGMPASLSKHPTTAAILRLLSILHDVNSNLDDVLLEDSRSVKLKGEPLSQFVNTKLTAKLNRQLEEPLIVASSCLPSWCEDLTKLYPFLFPFETRHLFLQSTSFGYSRSMNRWQTAQAANDSGRHDRHRDERPFMGKVQRQKVRISRNRILESAVKVMELYGGSPSVLEVEYFEEVGTGLGPTLEFYSTVSKEFSKKKLKLWRENESNDDDEYAFGKRGLFPAPMSEEQAGEANGQRILHFFKMLGKFVARSMLDSRIIDVSFNPTFFRLNDGDTSVSPSLGAIKSVDEDLARALKLLKRFANAKKAVDEDASMTPAQKVEAIQQIEVDGAKVEDLGLDFTLPGYPSIHLKADGASISVTIDNVAEYVDAVIDYTLGGGVKRQVEAFRAGFSQVFPYVAIKAFTPDELVMLFGRVEEDWSLETLMDSIKADHGFNLDSKSVRNLLHAMSELTATERRDFLQFVTGSPKLPIGGFKSLTPMFTVVCKPSEPPLTSDDYLPSVMTCVNYLKMPDYSTMDVLRQKLSIAIKEGQGAFHLS